MAIVKMKKLSLIGLESERAKILNVLSALGTVELKDTGEINQTRREVNQTQKDILLAKMNRLELFFDFVKQAKSPRAPEFKHEQLISAPESENRLLIEVDKSQNIQAKINALDARISNLSAEIVQLAPYCVSNTPLNAARDTRYTASLLGVVNNVDLKSLQALQRTYTKAEIVFKEFQKNGYVLFAVCLHSDKETLSAALGALGFAPCAFSYSVTAQEVTRKLQAEIEALQAERAELVSEGAALSAFTDEVKLLYDYYNIEHQKESGNGSISKTEQTFFLEAWLPAEQETQVHEAVNHTLSVSEIVFSKPAKSEEPPVLVKSNKFGEPFSMITDMYGKPSYREKDPNTVLGIFYFIFFGLLLADVGYGLVITLVSLIVLLAVKPKKETAKLFKIFLFGGISCIIWGVLFGSWFMVQSSAPLLRPLWFDPMENSMDMIVLTLFFGMLHIMAGFAMRAYNKISKRRVLDAVLDDFTWIGVFIGVMLAIAGMGVVRFIPANPILTQIGWYTALGFLAVLVFTGGRRNKKIAAKVFGGAGNLYAAVNLFSDVLSYLRLFGLALAGTVLGQVFNTLGLSFMSGSVFGYIMGGIVLLIGHTFNLALNLLGIYIHNSRLQLIEFFSKFYTGEGKAFKAFAGETKYITLKK
ncbi:MAG: V-type ATP synthase subunit I [Firmicutes bacterium]|nr:V-type ATP synthase subunit I [Bacillota bacterium]